ncbi:MAG: Serine protease, in family [Frankiales bacterium]|nr:Serine protease, in family [Frankiales bacterium]
MKRVAEVRAGAALVATVVLVIGAVNVGTAAAAPARGSTQPAKSQNVIVMLRNQHSDAPASKAKMTQRASALAVDQAPVRAQIAHLGGRTTHAYKTLNAVAATVPASGLAALRSDPSVASVVPDLTWRLPQRSAGSTSPGSASNSAAAGSASNRTICPTNPAEPLLEPEALQLTHTASGSAGEPTARSLGYDGTGIKVGFIADGLDVNQPDFIRADGSHVITDYQDFSGDGTDAPTPGGEAFGDAGSIAAQGRQVYDISTFVNAAHPLPAGCTIRVEGMAPGASMVGLKVFANALLTAPTSTIIQAIDWAVNVDHVDVLNESFGSNPYPDNASDPISAFNRDAVEAGVTVTASTGDAGSGNTLSTASTDPWVIAVGATTSERVYAQQTSYGFQFSNGRWNSNQLSSLSSGGIAQTRRVMDLLAPGDLNWSLCSDKQLADGSLQYFDCLDNNDNPTDLEVFGGTSESAPLAAGAAALVIQAYRKAHAGASPTPNQVREILTSSADDLGMPADQQGAGLLNSYRAVQLAASVNAPKSARSSSAGLLLSPSQVSVVATPHAPVTTHVTVTNEGTGAQRVTAKLRAVDTVSGRQQQTVALSAASPTGTFLDGFGIARSYVKTTFRVPVGVDRLDSTVSWGGDVGPLVRISLLDPKGTFTGYSLPQGTGNFGRLQLARPAPGTWTAIVWTTAGDGGFTGNVVLNNTEYRATKSGTVTPSTFTLAAGAKRRLTIRSTTPAQASNASSLVLTGRSGKTTTGSVVLQSVQPLRTGRTTIINGTFSTANGRSYSPGQADTYLFAVPAHAPSLNIALSLAGVPANQVVAHLADPSGEPISTVLNQRPTGTSTTTDPGLQIVHANPRAGIWQLTLELANPAAALPLHYRLTASLNRAKVSSHGIPTSTRTVISKQRGSTQQVTIRNNGPAPQTYFIDARTRTDQTFPLVAVQATSPGDPFTASIALPLPSEDVPAWLTPTEASKLTVGASATSPITFDVMPLDSPTALNAPNNPDTESTTGTSATAVHAATPVASALWAAFPSLIGPTPAAGASGESVDLQATVTARGFYTGYTSSTGDPLLATVSATAPTATPVTIPAGGEAVITLRLKPSAAVGSVQRGTVFVDSLQPYGALGLAGYADEVAALPFAFTVGS